MKRELAKGRRFDTYSKLMDAAVKQKTRDIFPWIKPGVIVDAGFGTGLILWYMAKRFPTSHLFGLDLSKNFISLAEKRFKNSKRVSVLRADVAEKNLPSNSVDTKIYSTVMHEVYSYKGYKISFVKKALQNSLKELRPGGRLIIRDGVRPQKETVYLKLKAGDGSNNTSLNAEKLSTEAMFLKFSKEFKHGNGVRYSIVSDKKIGLLYKMDSSAAYEFLCKKDYRKNWHIEVNEQFGYLTEKEYKKLLQKLGYKIIHSRSYLNPWILKNRWRRTSAVYKKRKGRFIKTSFPATNIVIVAKKTS